MRRVIILGEYFSISQQILEPKIIKTTPRHSNNNIISLITKPHHYLARAPTFYSTKRPQREFGAKLACELLVTLPFEESRLQFCNAIIYATLQQIEAYTTNNTGLYHIYIYIYIYI